MMSLVISLVLFGVVLFGPGGDQPVAHETVRPAAGVTDPIFAYLIGLVDADLRGTIDAGVLEDAVERSGAKTNLPYQTLRFLSRNQRKTGGGNTVTVHFEEPMRVPIPYAILGYRPGNLRASQKLSFHEYKLGDFTFTTGKQGSERRVLFRDVRLFGLTKGDLRIDFHRWIDLLAGGKLDDTRLTGLVLFEYGGERLGMALGYNRDWRGRSGVLCMRENKIRFPNPPEMKTAAWKLRRILERYEPSLKPASLDTAGGW